MIAVAQPETSQPQGFARTRVRLYVGVGLLVLAVVVQVTLLSRLRPLGVSPDLLVVMVACWGLLSGLSEGALWAFIAGLGLDLVAGLPLGTSSLALLAACLPARLGTNQMFGTNLMLPILIVVAATIVHGCTMTLLLSLQGQTADWASATVHIILPEMFLNTALVPLVYPLLRRLVSMPGRSRMEL